MISGENMAELNLAWIYGRTAGKAAFVRVGHNSTALNTDAVWKFTAPAAMIRSMTVSFAWNNNEAGTGWGAETYEYVFAVSADGSDGRFAAKNEQIQKVTQELHGSSGNISITFSDLELTAGGEYFIRANYNGAKYQTMKAFIKEGVTAEYEALPEEGLPFTPPEKTILVETSIKKDDDDDTTDLFILSGMNGLLTGSEDGSKFSAYTTETEEPLYACHYLGQNYIAVGGSGTVITSKDKGETWQKTQLETQEALLSVAYGNGLYIICGGVHIYATSDLENFEEVYQSEDEFDTRYGRLEAALYDGEKFIAGGFYGKLIISYDGYEWDEIGVQPSDNRATAAARAERYSYIGTQGGGIYRSADGYEWEEVRTPDERAVLGIAYGNGIYIACGTNDLLLRSRDGINWEDAAAAFTGADWNTAVFGNGKFIIGGMDKTTAKGKRESSKDGSRWTAMTDTNSYISGSCFGLSTFHEELRSKAEEAAAKYREVRKFSAEADTSGRPEYGKDYSIGDVCDIYFDGVSIRERITKVRYIIEPEKKAITPIFGEDYLNIRQIAKRISRFDE